MDLTALILYGLANGVMVCYYLRTQTGIYHFPFWAGVISLGWFFPQAVGGYVNLDLFPDTAFANGLYFASLCTLALWIGYESTVRSRTEGAAWLDVKYNLPRLYWASAALCLFGFYFQWKIYSLPDEIRSVAQWSGVAVKYLFFASVFQFGLISLWLLLLDQAKWWVPRLLIFVVPGLSMMFNASVIAGQREVMMDLVSYLIVGFWFAKGKTIPRWAVISGLVLGLVLINAIGTYRAIMLHGDMDFSERLTEAVTADYTSTSMDVLEESGSEFKNYIIYRHIYEDTASYDYGLVHWNLLVFNFVPAQIVGRGAKESLMIPLSNVKTVAQQEYGFSHKRGSTTTGYEDAFGSFGWFGCIKFLIIGWMMGTLFRHAGAGSLLGRLLYLYMLGSAMLAITHTTHRILFSKWVYFFALAYPAFYWAKARKPVDGNAGGAA